VPVRLPSASLLALLATGGCWGGLPEAGSAPGDAPSEPAEEIAPLPLAERLYAGEPGGLARALGDEVRILLWLRGLSLRPEQARALADTSRRVAAQGAALTRALNEAGRAELERLGPIYREMAAALAAGAPTDAQAADWAARLEAAQSRPAVDPRALRARYADAVLAEAADFLAGLDPAQRRGMVNALFFLRREVGDGVAPDDWDDLIGRPWRAGDFATLRRSASPTAHDHLDIGGLWTLEAGEMDLAGSITGLKLQALTALALTHTGLPAACAAILEAPADDAPPPGEGAP